MLGEANQDAAPRKHSANKTGVPHEGKQPLSPPPESWLGDFAQGEKQSVRTESSKAQLRTYFFRTERGQIQDSRTLLQTIQIWVVNNYEEAGSFIKTTS